MPLQCQALARACVIEHCQWRPSVPIATCSRSSITSRPIDSDGRSWAELTRSSSTCPIDVKTRTLARCRQPSPTRLYQQLPRPTSRPARRGRRGPRSGGSPGRAGPLAAWHGRDGTAAAHDVDPKISGSGPRTRSNTSTRLVGALPPGEGRNKTDGCGDEDERPAARPDRLDRRSAGARQDGRH